MLSHFSTIIFPTSFRVIFTFLRDSLWQQSIYFNENTHLRARFQNFIATEATHFSLTTQLDTAGVEISVIVEGLVRQRCPTMLDHSF